LFIVEPWGLAVEPDGTAEMGLLAVGPAMAGESIWMISAGKLSVSRFWQE
jgi:hypothetical protein